MPVIRSHAESIYIETERPLSTDEVKKAVQGFKGAVLVDDIKNMVYPMPLDTSNKTDVAVGRIRKDLYCETASISGYAVIRSAKGQPSMHCRLQST